MVNISMKAFEQMMAAEDLKSEWMYSRVFVRGLSSRWSCEGHPQGNP